MRDCLLFLKCTTGGGSDMYGSVGRRHPGTLTQPVNDSKGCGGVMRAAPAELITDDQLRPTDLAAIWLL